MTRLLPDLLEHASAEVVPVDLADRAWAQARARQRQVRVRVALAVAAATAVVLVAPRLAPAPAPKPAAPTSSFGKSGGMQLATVPVAGRTAWVLPGEGGEAELPWLDVGLPEHLNLPARIPPLDEQPIWRAAAVLLSPTGGGKFHPVLLDRAGQFALVDTVSLTPAKDGSGEFRLDLGPHTVDSTGASVVFAQRGGVVVLDVQSGRVRTIEVRDEGLYHAGWTVGGAQVVAWSDDFAWLIDPIRGTVRQIPKAAYDDHYQLVVESDGPRLLAFGADADQTEESAVAVPVSQVVGQTAGALTGWAATGVYLDTSANGELGGWYQGVVAVNADVPSSWRLLVSPDGAGPARQKGCCKALGWAGQQRVVVTARGASTWLLAWDISTGRLWRVAEVGPLFAYGSTVADQIAVGPLAEPRL